MVAVALVTIGVCGGARANPPSAPSPALDRAAALIRDRAFDRAAAILREVLSTEPTDRAAREMLAFALESSGDLDGERRVRASLAADFPQDARIQTDYGRVLERSGEDDAALVAYRRARMLTVGEADPALDSAIERMRGRTATEVEMPLVASREPDATDFRVQAGAAMPLGSRYQLAILGARHAAEGMTVPGRTTAEMLDLSFSIRNRSGGSVTLGPRFHEVSASGAGRADSAVGGALAGRLLLGRFFEAEASAEANAPWDEAAVAVLHGGRSTAALGRVYVHLLDRRLLLQAGGRRRELSILPSDPGATTRPGASQSLWIAGADLDVWRRPARAVRGEMRVDALTAPDTVSSALTLGYRHYEVSTSTSPEFASVLALVPRGSVDEVSGTVTAVSTAGRLAFRLRTGFGRDSARQVGMWRGEGEIIWAPRASLHLALGYGTATEVATGLVGRRSTGWLSCHVDL